LNNNGKDLLIIVGRGPKNRGMANASENENGKQGLMKCMGRESL
jgi:hypothetical protein